jgi:hypothetical protein
MERALRSNLFSALCSANAHHSTMRSNAILILSLPVLALTMGNRPVPKWQAFGNRPLKSVASCAAAVFARFGTVNLSWGEQPEAGSVRVFLSPKQAKRGPVVIAYLEGDEEFTSIWMDATDASLAANAWRRIRSNCGVR